MNRFNLQQNFEAQMRRYEAGEMSAEEKRQFEETLRIIETSDFGEDYAPIVAQLKQHRFAGPPQHVMQAYRSQLADIFPVEDKPAATAGRTIKWGQVFSGKPVWRYLQFAAVLLLGIFLGRWMLQPGSTTTEAAMMMPQPLLQIHDISSKDWQNLQKFLLESEMVLLEIDNMPEKITYDTDLVNQQIQTSKSLLAMIPIAEQIGVQMNDIKFVRFLGRLEMLLYEVANLSEKDTASELNLIQSIIRDSGLLFECRQLRLAIKQKPEGIEVL
jgi:hypothetical protein